MQKELECRSLILPFVIGIVLGITAKLVDVPYITCDFPIFDDIMRRFGIWVYGSGFKVFSRLPDRFITFYFIDYRMGFNRFC